MTRLGFAARGLMYASIGYLALRSGRTEDAGGVLDYLATGAGGFLVAAMAAGFFSYGAWRLLEAWIDSEGHGKDTKGDRRPPRRRRLGPGPSRPRRRRRARGAAHESGGGGDAPGRRRGDGAEPARRRGAAVDRRGDRRRRRHPAIPQGLVAEIPEPSEARGGEAGLDPWLGRAGFAARGIVFLVIGWLVVQAARSHSSAAAGGIDDALGSLPRSVQVAVAAGVILFGLFSLTEAVYRKMPATRR